MKLDKRDSVSQSFAEQKLSNPLDIMVPKETPEEIFADNVKQYESSPLNTDTQK